MLIGQARDIVQRVLDPLPLDIFLDDVLGKRFLKLPARDNRFGRALLGPDPRGAVLAAFATLAPKLAWHAAEPAGPAPDSGTIVDACAFQAKIGEYHARRYTVRTQDVRELHPAIALFTRAIEFLFYAPASSDVFWSRGGGKAPVHFDNYDNISVQLHGAKRWHISTDPSPLPNSWNAMPGVVPDFENYEEIDVEPGDLLYLPRGTLHRVEALQDSLHVSVGFVPLTLREAVIAAVDHLSDGSPAMRRTVGAQMARHIQTAEFGDLGARVHDAARLLATCCERSGFVDNALQRRASRAIAGFAKLPMPDADAVLTLDTRLRHSDTAICHLSATAETIDFAYPGGHHYIHSGALPGVAYIAGTPEFRIRDIPGAIADEVRLALVRQLVQSGFLDVA